MNGPSNGSNAPDPNTVTGWTVQGSAAQTSLDLGVPSPGYAQSAVNGVPSVFTGNGTPGVAYPPSNNTSASNTDQILTNPGYADVNPLYLTANTGIPAALVPVPASNVAFQSPVSLAATVIITGGEITSVKTASSGSSTFTQVGTTDGTYTVPAGGQIELTYSAAPTWTWATAATLGAA